jgi:tellurite resistance protein
MSGMDGASLGGMPEAKLEALVETMFLAAAADGEFSDVERAQFVTNLESLTDGRLNRASLAALLSRAERDLSEQGREQRLESVKQRLPELGARRVALALAVRVIAADGVIRTSERDLILETATVLGIDPDEAANLVRSVGG